ncbi:MAG: GIY-YIG nuclease family protein [Oscillospiraceae bacterium]|nr:GIY-YIG nuclease family protein [Oscillospiraceae bacterium]
MYYTYILRCADGSLYIGITNDLKRRFAAHQSGKGAKYTRSHPPARFEAAYASPDRAAASRLEARLKRLTHTEKEALINGAVPEKLDLSGYEKADITTI